MMKVITETLRVH